MIISFWNEDTVWGGYHTVAIDYKGLIAYARTKGVEPCDLSDEEKSRFIISKEAAVV